MQKNIVYGSITAGGNVHIGDKVYVIERDFPHSILFLRIERGSSGYEAMLSVKGADDVSVPLLHEHTQLLVHDELFEQVVEFQKLRRGADQTLRQKSPDTHPVQVLENTLSDTIYQSFFTGDIGVICTDFLNLLQSSKIRDLLLVISTEDEYIQGLPWEIVLPRLTVGNSDGLPRDNFGLVRSREKTLDGFNRQGPTAEGAPLKMLFIPALPENLPERSKLLEIEDEQRKIIEAVRGLEATGDQQPRLVMEILDCANLEEIQEALQKRSHDIVHISGHGAYVDAIKAGVLYLENEDGDEQQTTGHQLGTGLRQFSSIKLLVLSACETAVGGSEGSTAEQMAAVGLPAVLAMRFSVTDDGARLFTETLYTRLAYGDTLTKAMHDARLVLWKHVQKQRADSPQLLTSAEWFTPVLYQNQAIGSLLKPGQYNSDTLNRFYPATPFLAGTHTKFIGEGFIGRKRLLIQLRHCFKQGEHVCLHGLGGLGKTTTAEAFAESYRRRSGHDILIFRTGTEIQEAVILERIFEKWKYDSQSNGFLAQQLKSQLDDPKKTPVDKLKVLIDNCLKNNRTIIIFDNFEDVQIEQNGSQHQRIVSESLHTFIRYLLVSASSNCHVLFTSRYFISDLNESVTNIVIDKMTYAEQYRYINFSGILRGISAEQRDILNRRINGHPRALHFLEGLIGKGQSFDFSEMDASIGEVENKIFEDLLLERIYNKLDIEEKEIFVTSSVFFNRVPIEILSKLFKLTDTQSIAVIYSLSNWSLCYWDEINKLYEVHALTRTWTREKMYLSQEKFKQVSYQAGLYFSEKQTLSDTITAQAYFEQGEAWEDYVRVSLQIEEYFRSNGLHTSALELNKQILTKNISPDINAEMFNRIGMNNLSLGRPQIALPFFMNSLKIREQIKSKKGVAECMNNISQAHSMQGNDKAAFQYLEASLKIARQIGDTRGEGSTLHNLGTMMLSQKNLTKAQTYLDESLKIRVSIKDIRGQGNTLNSLSQIYVEKGEYKLALQYLDQSLEISRQVNNRRGEASILNNISQIYRIQKNYKAALVYLDKSLEIAQQIGHMVGEGDALFNIGKIYNAQGNDSRKVIKYLERSLMIRKEIGDQMSIATTLHTLGVAYFEKYRDFDNAIPLFLQALEILKQLGSSDTDAPEGYLTAIKIMIGEERFNKIGNVVEK